MARNSEGNLGTVQELQSALERQSLLEAEPPPAHEPKPPRRPLSAISPLLGLALVLLGAGYWTWKLARPAPAPPVAAPPVAPAPPALPAAMTPERALELARAGELVLNANARDPVAAPTGWMIDPHGGFALALPSKAALESLRTALSEDPAHPASFAAAVNAEERTRPVVLPLPGGGRLPLVRIPLRGR